MTRRPSLALLSGALLVLAGAGCAGTPGPAEPTRISAAPDTSTHYRVDARIRPDSARFDVSVEMRFSPREPTDTLRFLLHDDLEIRSLEAPTADGYVTDPWRLGGADTVHTKVVTIPLARTATPSDPVRLAWEYGGRLRNEHLALGGAVVTPHWIELPVEAMWVPVEASLATRFTFRATVDVPDGHEVVSTGTLRETGAGWRVRSMVPGPDVPLVISDRMRVRERGKGSLPVSVHHAGAPDSVTAFVARKAAEIVDRYDAWFRHGSETDALRLTIAPVERPGGSSYARTGFIALEHGIQPDRSLYGLLAHEAAHLWWTDAANPMSRHNFLNESFAEYAAWRSVRAEYGREPFRTELEEARKAAKDAPGFDEWTPARDGVLSYGKGPLLLHRLRQRIGGEEFTAFLRALQRNDVGTLEGMVATLETVAGDRTARWFEAQL